jgi:hypothetical protein
LLRLLEHPRGDAHHGPWFHRPRQYRAPEPHVAHASLRANRGHRGHPYTVGCDTLWGETLRLFRNAPSSSDCRRRALTRPELFHKSTRPPERLRTRVDPRRQCDPVGFSRSFPMFAMATRVSARPGGHAGLNQRTTSSSRGHVFQSAKSSRAVLSRPPRHRHGVSIKTSASLPETSAIAGDGVEGYVRVLELAYGDENLGNEVRDRMGTDRQFSIGIRGAMTDVSFSDR